MRDPAAVRRRLAEHQREELLERVSQASERPMAALGLVWLVLVAVDLAVGLPRFLSLLTQAIWVVFALHFLLELAIAPRKLRYLRNNWLTVVSLAAPALRLVRALRALTALRAAGGLRLIRVVSALNRATRSLGRVMRRRGIGYVSALTALVTAGGAAGMYAFEHGIAGSALDSYGTALWWTAMIITTMGSDYFPKSPEGRLLCLLLATYGFAVFGYVTATIASLFVTRDAEDDAGALTSAKELTALRHEIAALHAEVRALRAPSPNPER